MSDLLSKALLCGLGLASLTKDAIEKTAKDLIDQSKISEEEGRKLVDDLHKKSKEAQKALEKKVNNAVDRALKKLNLTTIKSHPKPAKPAAKAKKRSSAKK